MLNSENVLKPLSFTVTTEVLQTTILLKGNVEVVCVRPYYDLHGSIINEEIKVTKYKSSKTFRIVEKKIKYYWSRSEPTIMTEWEVYVGGKRFGQEYEITGYSYRNGLLELKGCVGAG